MCPSLAADGVQLAGRALCLKLTDEAARAWRIRTATYTVNFGSTTKASNVCATSYDVSSD